MERLGGTAVGTTLKAAALKSGKISEQDYDRIIVPGNMVGKGVGGA